MYIVNFLLRSGSNVAVGNFPDKESAERFIKKEVSKGLSEGDFEIVQPKNSDEVLIIERLSKTDKFNVAYLGTYQNEFVAQECIELMRKIGIKREFEIVDKKKYFENLLGVKTDWN